MEIISRENLETLKKAIKNAKTKKDVLKIVSENEIIKSFAIFCKNSKIADSKNLLLTVIQDKLQIFAVQKELQEAKKSNKNSKSSKRVISEKENSSLFSVFDLIFNKSKYLVNSDYLDSQYIKSIFESDKVKNYKADLYRRIKKFNDLSEKQNKNEKETEELKTLKSYLSDVFDCDEESQLITVLNNISSDSIKEAAQELANERVKSYNYDSFDSFVKVLKSFTVALDSNNLNELEKVLEEFLNFVETLQNPENTENNAENTEESDEKQ